MKQLLILFLLASGVASAQTTPPGYTLINSRYKWIAGIFPDGLHVPASCGFPVSKAGVWAGDGQLMLDSCNNRLYVYSNGWRRVTDSAALAAKVDSVSTNGGGDSLIVFKNAARYAYKLPNGGGGTTTGLAPAYWRRKSLVQTVNGGPDQGNAYEPNVIYDNSPQILTTKDSVFKMWRTGGWTIPVIRYSESADGINWTDRYLPVVNGYSRAIVLKRSSTYYMFASVGVLGTQIDRLTSSDGITWTVTHTSIITPGGWCGNGVFNMHVLDESGTFNMLLEGRLTTYGLGYYTSADLGITWTQPVTNPVLQGLSQGGPWFAKVGSTYLLYCHSGKSTGILPSNIHKYTASTLAGPWTDHGIVMKRRELNEGPGDTSGTSLGQLADPYMIQVGSSVYGYVAVSSDGANIAGKQQIKLFTIPQTLAQLLTFDETDADDIGTFESSYAYPTRFNPTGQQLGRDSTLGIGSSDSTPWKFIYRGVQVGKITGDYQWLFGGSGYPLSNELARFNGVVTGTGFSVGRVPTASQFDILSNTTSFSGYNVDNTNTSATTSLFGYRAHNGTGTTFIGMTGTNYTTYGVLTNNIAGGYSSAAFAWNSEVLHKWGIGANENMRLTTTGLGINVASPGARLHTDGTVRHENTGASITDTTTYKPAVLDASGNLRRATNWYGAGGGGSSGITVGTTTITSGTSGRIAFNNAGVYGESSSFQWDNTNARLGIGTASPGYKIHIVTGDAGSQGIMLKNSSSASNTYTNFRFENDASAFGNFGITSSGYSTYGNITASAFGMYTTSPIFFTVDGTQPITFAVGSGASEDMRVHTNGNIGVGETAPSEKLHVTGNQRTSGSAYFATSSGSVGIGTTSPSARLHLPAGTASANTAPMKMPSGTLMTTPEANAIENSGSALFYTTAAGARGRVQSNFAVVISSGTATMDIDYTYYVFTGTTATFTLPAVAAANTHAVFNIKNAGTGTLTINSSAGGNDIYDAAAGSSLLIAPGSARQLVLANSLWYVY